MALYFRLSQPLPIDKCCFGNFLTKKITHQVFSDGNELVFQNILKTSSGNREIRTRIAASGAILQVSRIPADSLPNNPEGLDGLLIYTRLLHEGAKSDDSEDVISIKMFNPSTSELENLRSDRFPVPKDYRGSARIGRISINEGEGNMQGSIVFSNGHNNALYKLDLAGEHQVQEVANKEFPIREPSSVYWLNNEVIVVVIERDFTNTLVFVNLSDQKKKSKQSNWLSKIVSGRVKYVGTAPSDDSSIVVLFSHGLQLLKYTKKGIKDDKEFKLALQERIFSRSPPRSWFPLGATKDGDSFYISSRQEILLLRKVGEPILLEVQEGIPGSIKPAGSGIFALDAGKVTHFCRFRLNKKRTNVFADFLGVLPKPADDLTLLAVTQNDHWGNQFWWKNGMDNVRSLFVTQHTVSVTHRHVSFQFDGLISKMWNTTTLDGLDCVLATSDNSSCLFLLKDDVLTPVTDKSWQSLDSRTLYADRDVQVISSKIQWRDGKAYSIEKAIAACAAGKNLVVANTNCVHIFVDSKCVKRLSVSETVIDIDCTDGSAAILTSSELYLFNFETLEMEEYVFDKFGTAVKIVDDSEVYIGTNKGNIFALFSATELSLSSSTIKSIFADPLHANRLLVTDMMSNTFAITKDRRMSRLSVGGLNWLCPVGNECLASVDGNIELIQFASTGSKYQMVEVPVAVGAQQVHFISSAVFALFWSTREIQIADTSNILDWRKYALPSLGENSDNMESQLFMIDKSHFLEVISKHPPDVDSSSEMEEDEADAFFEVHLTARLYRLDRDQHFIELLSEKYVTVDGDPYDEVIVKLIHSETIDELHFYIFTQSTSAVCGTFTFSTNEMVLKTVNRYLREDVYYDNWLVNDERKTLVIVGNSGRVVEVPLSALEGSRVPCPQLPEPSKQKNEEIPTIAESDKDIVFDVIALNRPEADGTRCFAAAIRSQSIEQFSRIVMFSLNGTNLKILAKLHLPHRKTALIAANSQSLVANDKMSPDFYLGACSGELYAVTYINDEILFDSLKSVQTTLLDDMGFLERPDQLAGSVDGSLLCEAAGIQELKQVFEDNKVSVTTIKNLVAAAKS